MVVIEQTETPDQLRERNDERAKKGLKKVGANANEVPCMQVVLQLVPLCVWAKPASGWLGGSGPAVWGGSHAALEAFAQPSHHPQNTISFPLADFCVSTHSCPPKQETVVRRDKVAVLTRGTLTDPEMLGAHPDAVFLLALAELPLPPAAAAAGERGLGASVWARGSRAQRWLNRSLSSRGGGCGGLVASRWWGRATTSHSHRLLRSCCATCARRGAGR